MRLDVRRAVELLDREVAAHGEDLFARAGHPNEHRAFRGSDGGQHAAVRRSVQTRVGVHLELGAARIFRSDVRKAGLAGLGKSMNHHVAGARKLGPEQGGWAPELAQLARLVVSADPEWCTGEASIDRLADTRAHSDDERVISPSDQAREAIVVGRHRVRRLGERNETSLLVVENDGRARRRTSDEHDPKREALHASC